MRLKIRLLLFSLLLFSMGSFAKISVPVPEESYQNFYLPFLESRGCGTLGTTFLRPYSSSDLREALEPYREAEECLLEPWQVLERDLLLRPVRENAVRSRFLWLGENAPVPLLARDTNGRTAEEGAALWFELAANAEMGQGWGLALSATPGFTGALSANSGTYGGFYFYEGGVKLGYGRAELEFGRRQLGFGDPAGNSFLFPRTGAPLDMLRLALRPGSNAEEIANRVSADLWIPVGAGTSSSIGTLKFAGGGLSVRPFDFVELGVYQAIQFADVPGVFGLADLPAAFFSFDQTGAAYQRALVFAGSFWCPSHFCRVYGQALAVADTLRTGTEFSPLVGIYFPVLGRLSLTVEYVSTSPHAFQQTGWPVVFGKGRAILGHPLGPDGDGLYLRIGLPAFARWRGEVTFQREIRGIRGLSPETRVQFGTSWRRRWLYMDLALEGSLANLSNARQVRGAEATVGALEAQFTYSFF